MPPGPRFRCGRGRTSRTRTRRSSSPRPPPHSRPWWWPHWGFDCRKTRQSGGRGAAAKEERSGRRGRLVVTRKPERERGAAAPRPHPRTPKHCTPQGHQTYQRLLAALQLRQGHFSQRSAARRKQCQQRQVGGQPGLHFWRCSWPFSVLRNGRERHRVPRLHRGRVHVPRLLRVARRVGRRHRGWSVRAGGWRPAGLMGSRHRPWAPSSHESRTCVHVLGLRASASVALFCFPSMLARVGHVRFGRWRQRRAHPCP